MKTFILDNYDSFTYNLVHLLHELGEDVVVGRNDCFGMDDVDAADRIILSPGPGIPSEAGGMMALIGSVAGKKPLLGICLGHQAIVEHYGGAIINQEKPFHGISSVLTVTDSSDPLFTSIPSTFQAGRYHSWSAQLPLPDVLSLTCVSSEGTAMAVRHRSLPVFGLQFHPESILTPYGKTIVKSFIEL
ncbi:MAG: anthranilate synthase component II [Flavobacteriales bacterium]